MGWNEAYWIGKEYRKEKALEHHKLMLKKYAADIQSSIKDTTVWDRDKINAVMKGAASPFCTGTPRITVENLDSVSSLFSHPKNLNVVLNFASYKNPGGGFLNGSSAQEESLCMESTLYEVLSSDNLSSYYNYNKANLNYALYKDRALWAPCVIFERNGTTIAADVLTVAAPNKRAYMEYGRGTVQEKEEKNERALRERINFIADLISIHNGTIDTAILGAFGCGVFGQDPKLVARLFKEAFEGRDLNTVYAVIDKGGHSKEGAYANFKDVLCEGKINEEENDKENLEL